MQGMRMKSHRRSFIPTHGNNRDEKRYFSYRPPAKAVPEKVAQGKAAQDKAAAPEPKRTETSKAASKPAMAKPRAKAASRAKKRRSPKVRV